MQRKVTALAVTYQPLMSRTLVVLTGICTVAVFLYGVFLLEAVAHAASRTAAERGIRELGSRLSSLETTYLSLTQALTPAKAHEMGYVAPLKVTTVFASANAHPLTLR